MLYHSGFTLPYERVFIIFLALHLIYSLSYLCFTYFKKCILYCVVLLYVQFYLFLRPRFYSSLHIFLSFLSSYIHSDFLSFPFIFNTLFFSFFLLGVVLAPSRSRVLIATLFLMLKNSSIQHFNHTFHKPTSTTSSWPLHPN